MYIVNEWFNKVCFASSCKKHLLMDIFYFSQLGDNMYWLWSSVAVYLNICLLLDVLRVVENSDSMKLREVHLMMKSFQTYVLDPVETLAIFFKPVPVAESTRALHSYTRMPGLESSQPSTSAASGNQIVSRCCNRSESVESLSQWSMQVRWSILALKSRAHFIRSQKNRSGVLMVP